MKYKSLLALSMLLAGLSFGQQKAEEPDLGTDEVPKNKRGHEILPKDGDIGIGFNVIPVFNMVFNSIRASSSSTADGLVNYTSNMNNQITGKYFIDPKTAVRVRLGINSLGGSITNRVQDAKVMADASKGTADDVAKASLFRVEDKMTFTKNNILLSVGLEKRRGYRRLQGVYGAEIGIGNESASQNFTYGNAFSDVHQVFYTNNFNGSVSTTTVNPDAPGRTERDVEISYRGGFRFGIRGFVGIEYFIAPKISIAAEYGWGWSWASRGAQKSTREVYNNGENGPTVFREDVNSDSRQVNRGFAVDNNNGSFFSMTNTAAGNTSLSGGAGAVTLLFHF